MAQPFTAKLGTFDFADYLRVGEDVQPTSVFEDPAFSDAPLGEGQPLISLDAKNREMAWPLFVTAGNKDALHAVVAAANRACQVPNSDLEWKDAGAGNSTFYDVTYARFEPNFNYRRGVQNWLAGVLRVYCAPPYGHTGTYTMLAGGSALGSGLSITLPLNATQGDAPAQLNVQIGMGSQMADREDGRLVGFSVVPSGRQVVFVGASLPALAYNATTIVDALVAGSLVAGRRELGAQPGPPDYFTRIDLSPATLYQGRNRIFAVMKGLAQMQSRDQQGNQLGPIAQASIVQAYQTLDLGVLSVRPASGQATVSAFIYGNDDQYVDRYFVLPEDATAYALDSDLPLISLRNTTVTNDLDDLNVAYATGPDGPMLNAQGGIPTALGGSQIDAGWQMQHALTDDLRVRVTVAGAAFASRGFFAGKSANSFPGSRVVAQVHNVNATTYVLSILTGGNTFLGATVLASMLVAAPSANAPFDTLEYRVAGPQVRARLLSAGSIVASLGASALFARGAGRAYVGVRASMTGGLSPAVTKFQVLALPSAPLAPRDVYMLGAEETSQTTQAGIFARSLEPFRRSAQAAATPGVPAQIVAFNLPIAGARTDDAISAAVFVRERFRYAR